MKPTTQNIEPFFPGTDGVDIIMPTYKTNIPLLKRAVESVLSQEFKGWTLYIAKDGGDVEIKPILDEYGDERIIYLDLPHKGKAATINTAIAKGTGRYIAYLDDDDLWYPTHLSAALEALSLHDTKFVHTDALEVHIEINKHQLKEKSRRILNRGPLSDTTYWYISHISTVHTRDLIDIVGQYDDQRSFFIDWDMFLRMATVAKMYHLKTVTCEHYMYLDNNNVATNTISYIHQANRKLSDQKHDEMFRRAFALLSPDDFVLIVKDWQRINSKTDTQTATIQSLQETIRSLETDNIELKAKIDVLESTIRTKDTQINNLADSVSALRKSLSWKITAPLRTIYEKLPLSNKIINASSPSTKTCEDELKLLTRHENSICIIAPRVPEFDRASGDLRLYRIIEILSHHYNIYFFNTCAWERYLTTGNTQYLDALNSLGTCYIDTFSNLQQLIKTDVVNVVVCEFYHLAQHYMSQVKALSPSVKFVIDTVDIHFYRERMMAETLGDESTKDEAERTKEHELEVYRKADYLWAVSRFDKEILLEEGCPSSKIQLVPNIHTVLPPPPGKADREKNTLLFIGGFVHAPNADAVHYFVSEIFPLVLASVPSAKLLVVGDSPPESVCALASPNVSIVGFVPETQKYLDSAVISVAPLRFGAGLKGKVGEALAAGTPLVTTSVGAQGMNLTTGIDCFVADRPSDFAESVIKLLQDDDLWQTFSRNGQSFMKENFSYPVIEQQLLSTLAEMKRSKL